MCVPTLTAPRGISPLPCRTYIGFRCFPFCLYFIILHFLEFMNQYPFTRSFALSVTSPLLACNKCLCLKNASPGTCLIRINVPRLLNTLRKIERHFLLFKSVLWNVWTFLCETDPRTLGNGTRTDFWKVDLAVGSRGNSTKSVSWVCLMRQITITSIWCRLFWKVVDSLCGQTTNAAVTKISTSSVNLNKCIRMQFCSSRWTEEELFALKEQINNIRIESSQIFALYQASAMGTPKGHALSTFVAAIRQVGGL